MARLLNCGLLPAALRRLPAISEPVETAGARDSPPSLSIGQLIKDFHSNAPECIIPTDGHEGGTIWEGRSRLPLTAG
jgi:hypothetical protein